MSKERFDRSAHLRGGASLPQLQNRIDRLQNATSNIATRFSQDFAKDPGAHGALYDTSDRTSDSFVDNALRVGNAQNNLVEKTLPALIRLTKEAQSIHDEKQQILLERAEKITTANKKIEQLKALEGKGMLPTGIANAAIHKLESEIAGLMEGPFEETATSPTAPETQPVIDVKDKEEKKPSKSKKEMRDTVNRLIREENGITTKELAQVLYGSSTIGKQRHAHYHITSAADHLAPDESLERIQEGAGRQRRIRFKIVSPKEPNLELQPTPSSEAQKKEAPFKQPIPKNRLQTLELILEGKSLSEIVGLFADERMKNGEPYKPTHIRWALQKNLNFLAIRRRIGKLTPEEADLWAKIMKAAGENADYTSAKERFSHTINSFFKVKPQPPETLITQEPETIVTEKTEEAKKHENLTDKEMAVLAQLIKQHDGIPVQIDTKLVPFNIPGEILEICDEILKHYMESGSLQNEDDRPAEIVRKATLEKIGEKFAGEEIAMEFISNHNGPVQTLLYFLESEREYIFELLVHEVQVQNMVDTKRLTLLEHGERIVGLKNGALDALRKRLGLPEEPKVIPPVKQPKISPAQATLPKKAEEKPVDKFEDMRSLLNSLLKNVLQKPEFASGIVTTAQLSRAFPILTVTYLERLRENGNIKPQGIAGNTRYSAVDAVIGIYLAENRNLSKAQLRNIMKVAQEEFDRIQKEIQGNQVNK